MQMSDYDTGRRAGELASWRAGELASWRAGSSVLPLSQRNLIREPEDPWRPLPGTPRNNTPPAEATGGLAGKGF